MSLLVGILITLYTWTVNFHLYKRLWHMILYFYFLVHDLFQSFFGFSIPPQQHPVQSGEMGSNLGKQWQLKPEKKNFSPLEFKVSNWSCCTFRISNIVKVLNAALQSPSYPLTVSRACRSLSSSHHQNSASQVPSPIHGFRDTVEAGSSIISSPPPDQFSHAFVWVRLAACKEIGSNNNHI